jgi:PadR family transcriptional regulator PadR
VAARRITKQTEQILSALVADPTQERSGSQIAPAAGLKSGTLYPALARLERFGWLVSRWEDVDPSEVGRPRRRLYLVTAEGKLAAEDIARRRSYRRSPTVRRRRLPDRGLA